MKYLIKLKYSLLVLIFALLASYPLLYPGLPPTHDGEYHVIRFYEFNKVLTSKIFYPRWAPDLNNGFGIPLFNYVYPLPNYFSSFLHFFGISFIDTFKLNLFFASVLGAVFFFLLARKFWGDLGGLLGSVVYTFSPYHFVDIYIRGSVGEVWALALFPAFLWSITNFSKQRKSFYFVLSALFLALLIFSHNILALMFFIFSLFFAVILIIGKKEKKELLIKVIFIFILGLCLSAIFWIPALLEKKYVVGLEIFDLKRNFVEPFQLIFPSWGSGFSGGSFENQMSFQLGIMNIIAILFSMYLLFKKCEYFLLRLFLVVSFFVICFLMLSFSYPVWVKLPLLNYFQFPWRFLSLTIFISSFLAGSLVGKNKKSIVFAIILICLSVVFSYQYTKPAYYMQRTDRYYVTRSNFIDGTNSIGNAFNTVWYKNTGKSKNLLKIDGTFKVLKKEPTRFEITLFVSKDTKARLNVAYFPGWKVFIDGKEKGISPSKDGKIEFYVSKGKHGLVANFNDTNLRKASSFISLFSFLLVLFWFLKLSYAKLKK